MTYLGFISDADLINAIKPIVKSMVSLSGNKANITRNKLDPFGALFECAGNGYDLNDWLKSEWVRQTQKTITNKIGNLHEAFIGGLDGCECAPKGEGLDILNIESAWCAEIKNKHNTTKGNHRPRLYDDIEKWVDTYTKRYGIQFTGYYVQIIPSKPEDMDKLFTPSDSGVKRPDNPHIREISGALFYEKITGHKTALFNLYKILPTVLKNEFSLDIKITDSQLESLFKSNIKN